MPTFSHGKTSALYINRTSANGGAALLPASLTAAGTYNLSSVFKEVSLPRPVDVAETSAFGTNGKSFVQGMYTSTLSASGMWDGTATINDGSGANPLTPDAILAGLVASLVNLRFIYLPTASGSAGTRTGFTGEGILTNYQISGSIGDLVAMSIEVQVTGDITRATNW